MKRRHFFRSLLASLLPLSAPLAKPVVSSKPRRILLLDSVVAGFSYYDGEKIWHQLKEGDPLTLRREPTNPYDEKAIEIFWKKHKLGYVPRVDNSALAQLLDRGESLTAEVTLLRESSNPWKRVSIRVWLCTA